MPPGPAWAGPSKESGRKTPASPKPQGSQQIGGQQRDAQVDQEARVVPYQQAMG